MLSVGLFEEGTVRRRVSVDRSGLDINEGNNIHWKSQGDARVLKCHWRNFQLISVIFFRRHHKNRLAVVNFVGFYKVDLNKVLIIFYFS